MTTTTTAVMMPAGAGIPAGDGDDGGAAPGGGPGRCKRPGCGRPLPPGVYTVNWHAVSVDTHHTQGSFNFTVAP